MNYQNFLSILINFNQLLINSLKRIFFQKYELDTFKHKSSRCHGWFVGWLDLMAYQSL